MKKQQFLLAFSIAVFLISCNGKKVDVGHDVLDVVTEQVASSSVFGSMTYVGQVEEESSISLSFTGSGAIKQLLVTEGQHVSAGQLVAVMDEGQAKNAVNATEAMLKQAKDGYERLKQVHEAGSLAEQQWVEMQSKLQQAQASYDMAKKNLQDCRLVSPVSGVVGKITLHAGETALPSMPVCTVLNINNVKIKVAVPEKEIGTISTSTHSIIKVAALGDKEYKGGSIEKGVTADAITRTYDIKINLHNPGQLLLPGMVANVSLAKTGSSTASDSRITLPVTAVQHSEWGYKFVWKVVSGKAKRCKVTLGDMQGNRVEILSGLQVGDNVIVEGYQKVSEDSDVKS
jgi:membrane fusion protein (multidrug efflux system)